MQWHDKLYNVCNINTDSVGGGGQYRLPCCPKPYYMYFTGKVIKIGACQSTAGSRPNYSRAATKSTAVTA